MTNIIYQSEVYELVSYIPKENVDSIGNMDAIIKKDGETKIVDDKEIERL